MRKIVSFNDNIEYIDENNNSYYSLLLAEGSDTCKFVSDNQNTEYEIDENVDYKFKINNIDVIDKVYNIFMNKYKHLDNESNRNLIYNLCTIAVNKIPQYRYNPKFYLNFIESSIQNIKKNNNI